MCAPCKVWIDNPGALASSARLLANSEGSSAALYAPAIYLAEIVTADATAILHGRTINVLDDALMDKAHAWSELNCHRATAIRNHVGGLGMPDSPKITPALLMRWAEEDRLFTTELVGGEYRGGYVVNGTDGITPK